MADSVIPSIISATSGLLGVGIGAYITMVREERKEQRLRQADAKYLAVLVSGHLDRLIRECNSVAWDIGVDDDGFPAGEHQGDRFHEPTTKPPKFEPLTLNVNWKALDSNLMARLLDLPGELDHLERAVGVKVSQDFPHYDGGFFPYRRYWYAEFAQSVVDLYGDVRATLGIDQIHSSRLSELRREVGKAFFDAREELAGYKVAEEDRRQRIAAREKAEEEEEARTKAAEQPATEA